MVKFSELIRFEAKRIKSFDVYQQKDIYYKYFFDLFVPILLDYMKYFKFKRRAIFQKDEASRIDI